MKFTLILVLAIVLVGLAVLVHFWNVPASIEEAAPMVRYVPPQVEEPPPENNPDKLYQEPPKPAEYSSNEVIRKSFVNRGTDYTENVFYKGDVEIARQTVSPKGEIQQTGVIPDGRVKYFDEFNGTKGEESYINGKRFGESKAFYADGPLKSEEKFQNDKLIYSKEYFHDGKLRSSVNFEDARDPQQGYDSREVGVGKLYYPNGTLKYEWNLTRSDSVGFKKSYNVDGTLRAETYYDERGNVIPGIAPTPTLAPEPAPQATVSPAIPVSP